MSDSDLRSYGYFGPPGRPTFDVVPNTGSVVLDVDLRAMAHGLKHHLDAHTAGVQEVLAAKIKEAVEGFNLEAAVRDAVARGMAEWRRTFERDVAYEVERRMSALAKVEVERRVAEEVVAFEDWRRAGGITPKVKAKAKKRSAR